MKMLITGSTGFLGKKLVEDLFKEYKLNCLVRKIPRDFPDAKNIEFVLGDLKNKKDIEKAIEDVEIIIHLATSEKAPSENIIFMENLLELSKKFKVKKVIFISSMAAKRTIKDNYGESKLYCENILKNSGITYTIIRPTIIYNHEHLPFFAKPVKIVPFLIPMIGDGKYKLNPIYQGDLINFLKKIIKDNKSDMQIYEIGGGESISFNEIIKLIKEEKEIKKIPIHIPIFLSRIVNKFFKYTSDESILGINEDTQVNMELAKKHFDFNPIKFREDIKNVNL